MRDEASWLRVQDSRLRVKGSGVTHSEKRSRKGMLPSGVAPSPLSISRVLPSPPRTSASRYVPRCVRRTMGLPGSEYLQRPGHHQQLLVPAPAAIVVGGVHVGERGGAGEHRLAYHKAARIGVLGSPSALGGGSRGVKTECGAALAAASGATWAAGGVRI